jgi:signal transduction histidine kinase
VENVLDNSVRHNQTGGLIQIALRATEGRARLTVETTGPPLDQTLVDDLARPFRRLRSDRTGSRQGAGLGLSIVAAIATAHQGRLDLHAREHGGLRVVIDLPIASSQHRNQLSGADAAPALLAGSRR